MKSRAATASASSLFFWILLLSASTSSNAQCTSQDFGISYYGTKVFSVSSQNNTCTCLNYASPGLADFDTAQIRSLSVGTVGSLDGVGNGTIAFRAGTTLDLASGDATRQTDAGKISYGGFGHAGTLNIVGGGTSVGTRRVDVLDEVRTGSLTTTGNYMCNGLDSTYFNINGAGAREPLTDAVLLADSLAVCRRTDSQLALLWDLVGNCGLCGSLACSSWGARWTGFLQAPLTGALTLVFTFDDALRFWWSDDGEPLVDSWSAPNVSTRANVTLNVTAGTYYPIFVEYYQNGGRFQLMMQWSYGSQAIQLVPSSALCTARSVQASASSSFGSFTTFTGRVWFPAGIGSAATPTVVRGGLTSNGLLTANAPAWFQDAVVVQGPALFAGAARAEAGLTVAGATRLNGTTTLVGGAALNVTGPTTLTSLRATGTSTLSTTSVTGAAGTAALSVVGAGGGYATANFTNGRVFMGAGATITSGSLSIPSGGGGLTVADLSALGTTTVAASTGTVGLAVTGASGQWAATFNGGNGVSVVGSLAVSGIVTNGGFDFILGVNDQTTRGSSGSSRALVKYTLNRLFINFHGDYTGGTVIESNLTVTGPAFFPLGIGNGVSPLTINSNAVVSGTLTVSSSLGVTGVATVGGLTTSAVAASRFGSTGSDFRSIRAITFSIGSGTNNKIINPVAFGVTYTNAAKLILSCTVVSAYGSVVPDSFACTIQSVTVSNFVAKIQRTDATSAWGDTTVVGHVLIYELF